MFKGTEKQVEYAEKLNSAVKAELSSQLAAKKASQEKSASEIKATKIMKLEESLAVLNKLANVEVEAGSFIEWAKEVGSCVAASLSNSAKYAAIEEEGGLYYYFEQLRELTTGKTEAEVEVEAEVVEFEVEAEVVEFEAFDQQLSIHTSVKVSENKVEVKNSEWPGAEIFDRSPGSTVEEAAEAAFLSASGYSPEEAEEQLIELGIIE